MLISGVQKFTMLDYPGKISCIVFTPGCNFRCGYCHNPEFVLPESIQKIKNSFIPEEKFLNFLRKREGFLDGVVISGGEPTMMGDLPAFMRKVKDAGFLVKLDTNGNNPTMLKKIISEKIVDYIAMDVKTSFGKYKELVGPCVDPSNIKESIKLIMESGVDYEFRSTVLSEIHDEATLKEMAEMVAGAKIIYLQKFRPAHTLDPRFNSCVPFTDEKMADIAAQIFAPRVGVVNIRS